VVQRKGFDNVKWRDVAFHLNDRVGDDCKERWLEVLEPRVRNARRPKSNEGANNILQAAGFDTFDEISSMKHNFGDKVNVDKKEIKQQKKAYKARQRESMKATSPGNSINSRDSRGSIGSDNSIGSSKGLNLNSPRSSSFTRQQSTPKEKANTAIGPVTFCVLSILVVIGSFLCGAVLSYARFHTNSNNGNNELPEYGVVSLDYCSSGKGCAVSWNIEAIDSQANDAFNTSAPSYSGNKRLSTRLWSGSDDLLDASLSTFATLIADMVDESGDDDDTYDGNKGDEVWLTKNELQVMVEMKRLRSASVFIYMCVCDMWYFKTCS
jgi:hypothetical protein